MNLGKRTPSNLPVSEMMQGHLLPAHRRQQQTQDDDIKATIKKISLPKIVDTVSLPSLQSSRLGDSLGTF